MENQVIKKEMVRGERRAHNNNKMGVSHIKPSQKQRGDNQTLLF